ncbi:putative COP9 signalosome complex subunit 5 [Rosellinia necatrix]|uniref:COP9 signalosome complex subunit 5 n=1 Tax=Rosellinia necatrix TaxID=77044 RepID=A0A1W2TEQ8_ROSNE|nr:putative COP9 signalosome complex subunit 5 [Rosellinia necatrix]
MEVAMKSWELDNDVKLVDPTRDALYNYSPERQKEANELRPWKSDPHHFKHVRISAVALIKMVMHARSGGSIEVMGLMQGYTDGDTIVVTDAFGLPVEGTETRVNAQDDANEYMIQYLQLSRDQGSREENVVGWYHSHPGYGCWLSGIDVGTEQMQQKFNDPFVAVVIDPDRTISAGRVEIGAFRTFPEGYEVAPASKPSSSLAANGGDADGGSSATTSVPLAKAEDFGAHASKYYSLEVSHFKSTLDNHLLELLWSKYWVQTLSQSPLLTNRDFGNKQMLDLGSKIRQATLAVQTTSRGSGLFQGSRKLDIDLEKIAQASHSVTMKEKQGLVAGEVKAKIFNGLGSATIA